MKKAWLIFLSVIGIISLLALKTIWQAGSFKSIQNKFSGSVQKIEGVTGAEDITIDQTTGIAFISSDDRWATTIQKKPIKGAIYKLNLNDSLPQPVNLTEDFSQADFHPHGISLFATAQGRKILFVVNHRGIGNFIEIFEYRNDSLNYLESISHELIMSPNDVVGVGERSFYVTNDHNEKPSGLRYIKDLLTIGSGNVCYFDGQTMQPTSIEGIKYANGVNMSADGQSLYLAAASDLKILIYDREIASGMLTKSGEVNTGTGVDNIEVDAVGNLWVGCHAQLLKFLSHVKDENAKSPSEIIRLKKLGNGKFEQETIYLNDGTEISGSSVGAVYQNKLLIGPVFQRHFLLAEMQ
jgi:arylesterase/paraoxonase